MVVGPQHLGPEPDTHVVHSPEPVEHDLTQLVLLALQPERMIGHVGQGAQVELGHHPFPPVSIGKPGSDQAPADHLIHHVEAVEQVERGRVESGGPQLPGQLGSRLQKGHFYALGDQRGGGHASHRPCTNHDDVGGWHRSELAQHHPMADELIVDVQGA